MHSFVCTNTSWMQIPGKLQLKPMMSTCDCAQTPFIRTFVHKAYVKTQQQAVLAVLIPSQLGDSILANTQYTYESYTPAQILHPCI